jgi:hypothetical protein
MCIISDKIKFCTCAKSSVEKLKHYWILYRYAKGKEELCMGMPMMPTSMRDLSFEENQSTLLNRLNEADAFDTPLKFNEKDLLEIVINNTLDFDATFTYSFKFKKGKWVAEETDPFEVMNHFNEEESGKIKTALKIIKHDN